MKKFDKMNKKLEVVITAKLDYGIDEYKDMKYAMRDIEDKLETLQEVGSVEISINIVNKK